MCSSITATGKINGKTVSDINVINPGDWWGKTWLLEIGGSYWPLFLVVQAYLETRPPIESPKVFVGERGPLTDRGIRNLCDKYSAICGFKIHPHLLRHTMAHKFLDDNPGDLVALAQVLGHENLNTTKRYVQRTEQQLGEAAERLSY